MKKSTNSEVGDVRSPASRKFVNDLRKQVDSAALAPVTASSVAPPSPVFNAISSISALENRKTQASTCQQKVWFSFFFDGTGNNLDADFVLEKHSNIAKLYQAHSQTDTIAGIHSVYIPGIGTYFREIGDPGGTVLGAAFGAMGEARLSFALAQFDKYLRRPLARAEAPGNAIQEIALAVFGFSRGAALARAFVNLLMEKRCAQKNRAWILKNGEWPVKFHFMGLFDTVASVGHPMSRNNTDFYNPAISDVRGMLDERAVDYADTRPVRLAFSEQGVAGADPAPGRHAGHESWASKLGIHESVEEVRHFVAAHEIRNSFPLDSISVFGKGCITKPAHFFEIVYPGAHSDVGGGYAPGEGGKLRAKGENLSLISLRHMYDFAIAKGVPLLHESNLCADDFNISDKLKKSYSKYMKAVGEFSSLGEGFNKHMKLYLAWRFWRMKKNIGKNGDHSELVQKHEKQFSAKRRSYEVRLAELEKKLKLAEVSLAVARGASEYSRESSDAVERAREVVEREKHEFLKIKAEHDAVPDMSKLKSLTEMYDQQLLVDVKSILELSKSTQQRRIKNLLRPHYQGLVESFEREIYEIDKSQDDSVFAFFEDYVHDSLSAFGRDATFPSDPRVIYIGGDEKLRYADSTKPNAETMAA